MTDNIALLLTVLVAANVILITLRGRARVAPPAPGGSIH